MKLLNKFNKPAKGLFLIDLSWVLYRGIFAFKHFFVEDSNGDKVKTGHFFYSSQLTRTSQLAYPYYATIYCCDEYPKEKHKLYPEYKAGRGPRPFDREKDTKIIMDILSFMPGCYKAHSPAEEADSVMAAFAKRSSLPVIVFSGDDDLLQLMNENVSVVRKFDKGSPIVIGSDHLLKKYGVDASELLMYRAIRGDTSDNIKGYYRFPKRIAVHLAKRFKEPEELINGSAGLSTDKTLVKYWKLIKADPDILRRNFKLMELVEVPIKISKTMDELHFLSEINKYKLNTLSGMYNNRYVK